MPTTSSDQGLALPTGTDTAGSFPGAMAGYNTGAESRLVLRYTSTADRTTRHPTPVDGEVSILTDVDKAQIVRAGVWEGFHRALVQPAAQAESTTTVSIPTGVTGISGYELTGTALVLPIEGFDNANMFTASDSFMTVVDAGLYTCEGFVQFELNVTTGTRICRLNILNSDNTLARSREFVIPATGSTSINSESHGAWTLPLTTGQKVQLTCKHSRGSDLNVLAASLAVTQQAVA